MERLSFLGLGLKRALTLWCLLLLLTHLAYRRTYVAVQLNQARPFFVQPNFGPSFTLHLSNNENEEERESKLKEQQIVILY
ncbi:hypothetical protein M0802_000085 [Mischocyttarus mexicanus]|nr:hypothetical protein M0802_000085 [Mischocyttarus mexicanus]